MYLHDVVISVLSVSKYVKIDTSKTMRFFFFKKKARMIMQGLHKWIWPHGEAKYVIATIVSTLAALVVLFSAPLGIGIFTSHAAASTTTAVVTVDGAHTLSTLSPLSIGTNTAVWDSHLQDAAVPGLLRQDGVQVMRFPGGSTSDTYHWQTNTDEPGNTSAGSNTFDDFMGVVRKVGAQPMITVNYGSGTPEEAAAWVRYANDIKHYDVKYWEIGNELYGNGTYGANWEYDTHAVKGPTAYANNTLQFIQAMKSVDPSIKIGVVLTAPGDWPDGVVASGDTADWNHTVLSILGNKLDFADVHWYADYTAPGTENDQILLSNPSGAIPHMVSTLRTELEQYQGNRGKSTPIMLTETNSVPYSPGKQSVSLVNALFLAADYTNWLEQGVTNVDWWDTHNGMVTGTNNSSTLYGNAQYGDYGMLSAGDSANGLSEPPVDTPFPAYYGLQMVHDLIGTGGQMLSAISDQNLVEVHAVRHQNGQLSIILINKDPSNSYTASLALSHVAATHSATIYTYGEQSTGVSVRNVGGLRAPVQEKLAPYSITTISFH
jgi:hypothetical protein